MDAVVISLLAPVDARPAQQWVQERVDALRARAQATGVRLGRLAASHPREGGDWLIEVTRDERDVALENDVALAAIVAELEYLGLRPCLFVIAREPGGRRPRDVHRSGADAARRQLARHSRPPCRRPA